jgi:hypothetical protein
MGASHTCVPYNISAVALAFPTRTLIDAPMLCMSFHPLTGAARRRTRLRGYGTAGFHGGHPGSP